MPGSRAYSEPFVQIPELSIIISTCNRSERLRLTLEGLAALEIAPGVTWEALIVDNNSSDDTAGVIRSFERENPSRFCYLFEKRRGKSFALNTGLEKARGSILVFTDDDCIADARWLESIHEEFRADPSLGVIGGRVELYDKDDRSVSVRFSRERIPFLDPGQLFSLIIGCNMAVRRSVFETVGGFDTRFGPGTRIGSTVDTEWLYRPFRAGFKMVYTPNVMIYHNHGRSTDKEIESLHRRYLIGRGAFYTKYILRGDVVVLRMAYWELLTDIKGLFRELYTGRVVRKQLRMLLNLLTGCPYFLGITFVKFLKGERFYVPTFVLNSKDTV